MFRKLVLIMFVVAFVSACAAPGTKPVRKDFDVLLQAKPNQGYVKIDSAPQGWRNSRKRNGYVGFDRGESGEIRFKIKTEKRRDCADGAKWVITRLQLTADGATNTEKGERDSFGTDQPAWLREAFESLDNDQGDYFRAKTLNDGVTTLTVVNDNQQRGSRWIYYQITVDSCDGEDRLRTDPVIRNGGKR